MASDILVFDSIARSNMPLERKSMFAQWAGKLLGPVAPYLPSQKHVARGISAVRLAGETAITGGVLGMVHAERATGLDTKHAPIDGVVAALGLVGSVAGANSEFAGDMANIGGAALSVFTFRKAHDFWAAKKAGGTSTAHGESTVEGDPIVLAAKECDPV